jgi:hypothetical protein
MGLQYAAEKLGAAILCVMQSEDSPQQRLATCCEIFAVPGNREHLTGELRKRFDAVLEACSTDLNAMDDQTAGKWLAEMLAIYTEVVQALPIYDAGSQYERRAKPRPSKNI